MAQMVNQFSQVPVANFPRNVFERNHTWKGTINGGYLYPVFFEEVLPGDTKKLNTTFFGRLATPIVPVLDNIWLNYQLYFVPNRLTWDNWQKFMGERKNPDDSIDFTVPTITAGSSGYQRLGLLDYFSVPPAVANLKASSLTFYLRAYNLIWNEWYRDENLQDSVNVPTGDGPDTESMYTLLKRGKRGDYFTTCLPSPQKGPGVELPLGESCPVIGNGMTLGLTDGSKNAGLYAASGNSANFLTSTISLYGTETGTAPDGTSRFNQNKSLGVTSDPTKSGIIADLSSATSITINSMRQAIALQQFLEQDSRGGTRYVELILSHYGVRCPDYRLQRPEYLGGSTTRINVSPIAQTSSTDTTTPQGNLAAIGTVGSTGSGFTHSFTEHGVILGLVCVYTDLTYQYGLDRHFSRNTRYDYFFPTLAHLGDQAVYNKEIYAQGTAADDEIFGYNERYAEYRYRNSYITSEFRSSYPQSLDIWHFAQAYDSLPTLSSDFIEENPPLERANAVQTEPQLLLDVYHDFTDIKEVPLYGVPGLRRI